MPPASPLKQRLFGVFVLVIGSGLAAWEWSGALSRGTYHPKVAFLGPAFAVLGLTLLLFPVSSADLMARYGVDKPGSLRHYTWPQKLMFLLALAAGAVNVALMGGL